MKAQVNLGFCYANGTVVAADNHEAVKLYMRAAVTGDAVAQFNLALCYENSIKISATLRLPKNKMLTAMKVTGGI